MGSSESGALVFKSVKQNYEPNSAIVNLLDVFRHMVNDCVRIGLENNTHNMKRLSQLAYGYLAKYDTLNYYKLGAISRAAGILSARRKSLKRGVPTKSPYSLKLQLVSCYGFKVSNNLLRIPIVNRQYVEIPLNKYALQVLSSEPNLVIRSFTLTSNTVSISYAKAISERECISSAGVDRNLRNVTHGDSKKVTQYDLSRSIEIIEAANDAVKSFKRNDARIRKKLATKYGRKRRNKINHMLHNISKTIAIQAFTDKQAIVLEDIRHIRRLYRRGNGQGSNHRRTMNSWSFAEIKRQIEYKAKWLGVPIIQLSVKDTQHTSTLCPQCGERLQEGKRSDRHHHRQLWCLPCKRWLDRDVVSVMNQSLKGWVMFAHSKGVVHEAVKGNLEVNPVILRVDATKPNPLFPERVVTNYTSGRIGRTKIISGIIRCL